MRINLSVLLVAFVASISLVPLDALANIGVFYESGCNPERCDKKLEGISITITYYIVESGKTETKKKFPLVEYDCAYNITPESKDAIKQALKEIADEGGTLGFIYVPELVPVTGTDADKIVEAIQKAFKKKDPCYKK